MKGKTEKQRACWSTSEVSVPCRAVKPPLQPCAGAERLQDRVTSEGPVQSSAHCMLPFD